MNNIINFIKNKKLLIFALISIISIIFIYIKINIPKEIKKEILEKKNNLASYSEIKPGDSFSEEKANELLGFPVSATSSGNVKVNDYKSSNQYRNNQIKILNDKIFFVREVINLNDNKNSNSIIGVYGNPSNILYAKKSDSSFNLYVYLENGIAYLGHEDGTVLEIWYFEPTDIKTFISNYAKNYQEEPYTVQTGY